MDRMLHRKINLLVHLAHADGKFEPSEKEMLRAMLKQSGLPEAYLEEHRALAVDLEQLKAISNKSELLYWIMLLIKADGQLHVEELTYAKTIARQLGYKGEVIDQISTNSVKSLADFEQMTKAFKE
jgi:uncharacterized tellurite resistance protein B-like protein